MKGRRKGLSREAIKQQPNSNARHEFATFGMTDKLLPLVQTVAKSRSQNSAILKAFDALCSRLADEAEEADSDWMFDPLNEELRLDGAVKSLIAQLLPALRELNVEFFQRLADAVRAVHSFREGKTYESPVGYLFAREYFQCVLEREADNSAEAYENLGDLKNSRDIREVSRAIDSYVSKLRSLPTFREVVERCQADKLWPREGDSEKGAWKVVKSAGYQLAPGKRGPQSPLLYRKEIAAHFRRHRATVYRWEREGLCLTDGRASIEEVERFLRERDEARKRGIPFSAKSKG